MGWKENRRRKRTWYLHYRWLADQVKGMIERGEFAPEAMVEIMYRLYESRRLHGKRFIAESAYESMRLACEDAGLGRYSLVPQRYSSGRPPGAPGELYPPEVVRTTRRPDGPRRQQAPGPSQRYVTPQPENQPAEEPRPMRGSMEPGVFVGTMSDLPAASLP